MPSHFSQVTKTLRDEAFALETLATKANAGDFDTVIELILSINGKVVVTGVGKSGLIGAKIAATFASTGTPAQFMHTGDAGHGDLGMVSKGDIIIALSNSGQSRELVNVVSYAQQMQIPLVAVTAAPDSLLGRGADHILQIPDLPEACPLGLAPMTSTTLQLAVGDGLAAALIVARGFTQMEFGRRHLAGALGAKTKTLNDYFKENDQQNALPSVKPNATIADVVEEISAGRMGATAVLQDDELLGIITDGDIRRALVNGRIESPAKDIMSEKPIVLEASDTLVSAVDTMRTHTISVILVKKDNSHAMVHLQDLLALGL